jgi:hypothetical protein
MKETTMNLITGIVVLIILLVNLHLSACTIPWDTPQKGIENHQNDDRDVKGTVTGKICYPSESIPPMTLYFQSTHDDRFETMRIDADQDKYSIDLDPGTYIAYAYPENDFIIGGMYSVMVPCGLASNCKDHSFIPIDVEAGNTTNGVDICDWYAEPSAIPIPPGAMISNIPEIKDEPDPGFAAKDARLTARLDLPERLNIGEEINLKFTLTNESDTPLYFLKWYTPLEGIAGEIFKITRDGQAVPYEGILASRAFPTIDSYILINPSEAVSAVVDLSTSYDFSKTGTYRIGFLSPRISHIAGSEEEMAKTNDELGPVQILSNLLTLAIVDN